MDRIDAKLTAVANEIRELTGATKKLGLDDMAVNVREGNDEILMQKDLIEQAVAALEGKVTPDLYNQGYADGYEIGNAEGYTKGHTAGVSVGTESLVLRTIERFSSDSVVTINIAMFQDCTELEELNMPNLESIPNSMCARCAKLKKIIFPRLTGAVGISSFQTCTSLEYADIGEAASLGAAAFHGCRPLSTLIVRKNDIAPLDSSNTLSNTSIATGTGYIYVPDNLVDQYKAATNWSTYAAQIKPLSELEG